MFVENYTNSGEAHKKHADTSQNTYKNQPNELDELDDIAKQLKNDIEEQKKLAKTQARESTRAAARDKANAYKSRLQLQLNHGNHSEAVKAHIHSAIDSCNACLESPEHEHQESAHQMETHLGQAHNHVTNAIHTQQQMPHCGRHHQPPVFCGFSHEHHPQEVHH